MNTELFTQRVQRMRPMLLSTALGILGNEEDAEDVVQDALLRLWQLHEEDIQNLEGMARVIVRNLAVDKVRKRIPLSGVDDVDIPDVTTTEYMSEREERLMALVEALPVLQQTILRLRHMEGMEMKDIAQIAGTTEDNIRKILSRSRMKLLEQMKKGGIK